MDNEVKDIHDEENYDPTVWVPKAHSHGTKDLWKVFVILSVLTIIDIVFYFMFDPGMGRNITFIGLGVIKAFYIVFTFMHLKYEMKGLQKIITWPMILVIYLIWLALTEGSFVNGVRDMIYH
jgi:cytochrome c oxidase subunit IV